MNDSEYSSEMDIIGSIGNLEPKDGNIGIFVPSMQRDGTPLDHEKWRRDTIHLMSSLFGGATAVQGFGGWLDEERGNKVKSEAISIVVSFITASELTEKKKEGLKKYLHKMGREAKQGEIGYLLNGIFYRLRNFEDE